MNREQKAQITTSFGGSAANTPFILIAEFRGTKVSEINQVRRDLEKNGMQFKVIKNTLAKRAFAEAGVQGLDGYLKGMTGVVFSGPDPIASARVLRDVLKPFPTIQARAGLFEGGVVAGDAVKVVADLPGRPELLSQLLATMLEGPRQLMRVLTGPARELVQVLKNHEDKLSSAGE